MTGLRTILLTLLLTAPSLGAHAGGPYLPTVLTEADWETLHALEVSADSVVTRGENTRLISSALAVLLGPFGAHRLYLGTTPKVAVIYGVTFGGFGLLALLDLGHILFTKDLGPYRDNDRVFMWNGAESSTAPTPP